MRKYASDLTTNDILIVNGERVEIQYLDIADDGKVKIEGFYSDNGDGFVVSVDPDWTFGIARP